MIVVTSSDDSGPGTLRQALLDAQSGDTITFDPSIFPPDAPTTIQLSSLDGPSALPKIEVGGVTIDASNAGVILDGSANQGAWVNGLEIYSSGNTVRGLQIVNFSQGIVICGGSNNLIGGGRENGDGPTGQGNLISGIRWFGINVCTSGSDNTIVGNIIEGNTGVGVFIEEGPTDNTIGPDNTISHNGGEGVVVWGATSHGATISQNSIHDNAMGIRLFAGANRLIDPPVISNLDMAAGTVSGAACSECVIEIFSASGVEGDIFEGRTTADGEGLFTYDHGSAFAGPYLSATATDPDGNTSEFPRLIPSYGSLQMGNDEPIVELLTRPSGELTDNRIGILVNNLWNPQPEVFPDGEVNADHILSQGVTRVHLAISNQEPPVQWDEPEIPIDPSHDEFITRLANNGMTLTFILTFWDKEYVAAGGELGAPRFKTEEEIQRYLDFVRYMVRQLKDRVEYFEIWNEPNGLIDLDDYINLVARAVPVIREEFPEAKIVVGGVSDIRPQDTYDYLVGIIESDEIMPVVDAVSWHGMFGASPEYDYYREYYYDYPSMVAEIREIAASHGFIGEFVSDELNWATRATPCHCRENDIETLYSETGAAKYFARGILMNLGLDLLVSHFYVVPSGDPQLILDTIRNTSTIMAGAQATDLPVSVQSEATDIVTYTFSMSNGDLLVALWTDGVAADVDLGTEATVTVAGLSAQTTTAIDAVYGLQTELITDSVDGDLVIRGLLVRDSPLVLHFSGVSLP